jgi:hypothetical protein
MRESLREVVKYLVAAVPNLGDDSLKYLSRLKKNAARLVFGVRDRYKLGAFRIRNRYRALQLVVIASDKVVTRERIEFYGNKSIDKVILSYRSALGARGG